MFISTLVTHSYSMAFRALMNLFKMFDSHLCHILLTGGSCSSQTALVHTATVTCLMSLQGNMRNDSNIMRHSSREITHLAFVKSCGSCKKSEHYLRQAS